MDLNTVVMMTAYCDCMNTFFVFRTATLYFYYRAIVVGCNLKLRLMAALKSNLLISIAKSMPVCKDKLQWRPGR
jgi:hypothetical protein